MILEEILIYLSEVHMIASIIRFLIHKVIIIIKIKPFLCILYNMCTTIEKKKRSLQGHN